MRMTAESLAGNFGVVQRNWPHVPLGELCRIDASLVDPRQPDFSHLPHVSGEDIESATGRLLPLHSAAEDGMISGKYLFDPGVVLYSKLRPYLRKVTVANFRGLCSADMYPLAFDRERVCPDFAKFALLSDDFSTFAIESSARARMPKLNREQLFAYRFPLPPLAEQRGIAKYLTQTLTQVDAARQAAIERLAMAKELKISFPQVVFDQLAWPAVRLEDIGEIVAGVTLGQRLHAREGREVSYLRVANVKTKKKLLDVCDLWCIVSLPGGATALPGDPPARPASAWSSCCFCFYSSSGSSPNSTPTCSAMASKGSALTVSPRLAESTST